MVYRTLLAGALAAIVCTVSSSATTATIDPELEKQEREVERLLRNAEAEFWSLKHRIESDRTDRSQRLAQAKAEYEKAQLTATTSTDKRSASDRTVAAHKADQALERYQSELERALSGVDSARVALDLVEARVSQYRAALEALRRRTRGTQQQPGSSPVRPDSSTARKPITSTSASDVRSCS